MLWTVQSIIRESNTGAAECKLCPPLSTLYRYVLPVAETSLYSKGNQQQWDAESRIDRSLPVDPEDPMQMDDSVVPLFGTPLWARLGEARIVHDVPRIESKFYAATQVMDEVRHVDAYRRLLTEKFRFVYPISKPLKTLIEQALTDARWVFNYLGMQVLIEGLALVAFQRIHDYSKNPLCQAVNAYLMQDEARPEGRVGPLPYPRALARFANSLRTSAAPPGTAAAGAFLAARSPHQPQ